MKNIFTTLLLCTAFASQATTIEVGSAAELNKVAAAAKPGDTILLRSGQWKDAVIILDARGTEAKPIVIMAAQAGKLSIGGHSSLRIGGEWLEVHGLLFTNGYAGDDAVISFRSAKNKLANHCRVTNCSIAFFNNPMRMDENYWVSFYGKNNRLDHCSFRGKLNMGVLLAVILDDERSRETQHSIDHNYFGTRQPLASNSGEIIRVGVSQHCQYNANVRISHNYFEHCDGETEIVSIKSGGNLVANNLFKESQGSVVLRHGDNNTVRNNIFLGNNKNGTGGVRVINKGQWVFNNFFYQCTGAGFRAPLAVMNGVPNSPANRYVAAQDAVIANNSFVQCTPLSFCEGSDEERSQAPDNIFFLNNIIADTGTSFRVFDQLSGFHFAGNATSSTPRPQVPGFEQASLTSTPVLTASLPASTLPPAAIPDSLQQMARQKLETTLPNTVGFANVSLIRETVHLAETTTGTNWKMASPAAAKTAEYRASNAAQLQKILATAKGNCIITLTGKRYLLLQPMVINHNVQIKGGKNTITINNGRVLPFLFLVNGGGTLRISDCHFNLQNLQAGTFISTDTSGSSMHANLQITGSSFTGFAHNFFTAARSSVCDSIVLSRNAFKNGMGLLLDFTQETGKKGYYNVEQLRLHNNSFYNHNGQVLAMLRGGNDESTMGPLVQLSSNHFENCNSAAKPLVDFYGTQVSTVTQNKFVNCNAGSILIKWEDVVKAKHICSGNEMVNSGRLAPDEFTQVN